MSGTALATVKHWLLQVLAIAVSIFGLVESVLRRILSGLGVPHNLQSAIILIVDVLFIIVVLRVFGGLLRLLLVVFLVLLLLHVLLPGMGF